MVQKTTDVKLVQSLLYTDEFINSPMIRLLDIPNLDVQMWVNDTGHSSDVLLVKSTAPGTWDAAQYPAQWKRVWLEALTGQGANVLLDYVPKGEPFIFKFHRPWLAAYFTRVLPLEWKQTLCYFTLAADGFTDRQSHEVVQLSWEHMSEATALLQHSGRSIDNLQQAFSHPQAAVFGYFQDGALVSSAFVDPRTKRTLEICAVYTAEKHRGQGLAASVVSAATRWILEQGKMPVYATRITNAASMSLAQSLGFTEYGQVSHYYCAGL